MKLPFNFDPENSEHLDWVETNIDNIDEETLKSIYNIVDVDIKNKSWSKFVSYNIKDVELVDRLEDKMKLIELALTMAYDGKVNYEDVFSQVRMWDTIIYNYLKKRDIVIPPKEKTDKDSKYAGAYVKEPVPGIYNWIVSLDLDSMYPHLIMQYGISPETLVEKKHPTITVEKVLNKELDFSEYKNYSICANGSMYRKDINGFIPELMNKMYNERVIFKEKMIEAKKEYEKNPTKQIEKDISRYNNIQMAKKISLNSCYGSLGTPYFRYYKLENAEAITLSGQVAIRWIENKLNKYMNKILKTEDIDFVIASDTDSVVLNMGPLVKSIFSEKDQDTHKIINFLDKVCKLELEKYIEKSYQELADYTNACEQKMHMKRENIADRGIWTAKKRYILNVWDSEGVRYSEPKLKIMGIEAVKSSTPAPCRKMIKDGLKIMMSGTEEQVIEYINNCRTEFKKLPPEQIAFPRTASDIRKYSSHSGIYTKGTPIHVRGSLLFNHYIKEKNLTNKYSLIGNGEKVKFIYLKKPNIIQENVISFISEFPKELRLDKYIDYELQFEKAFISPLKAILDAIGWKTEHTANLDSFFT